MASTARSTSRHRLHGRTLHLVDVENLSGGRAAGPEAVSPAIAAYRRTVAVGAEAA
jgi:hypothetical protein